MSAIFISYANEDRERARSLAQALEQSGLAVWWDRKIPLGKAFDEVIEQHLAAARCVLVLWTGVSVESRWVRAEASEAAAREVLIPVLLEPELKLPLEFRLLQAADLRGWQGDPADTEFRALLAHIEAMLHRDVAPGQLETAPALVPLAAARPTGSDAAARPSPGGRTRRGSQGARAQGLRQAAGFILLPTALVATAALVAMNWRVPTHVRLDLVAERVSFTLAGEQAVQLPPDPLSFAVLSVENFDRAVFSPRRLRVSVDAGGAAHSLREAPVRGEVVVRGADDETPLLLVEAAGGGSGQSGAGRLQSLTGAPGTRVVLEAKPGRDPRFMLRMDGQELDTNILPAGDLALRISNAIVDGIAGLEPADGQLSLQIALAQDHPVVQLHGARRFFVVTVQLDAPATLPLLREAQVEGIAFLEQGDGGRVESALVGAGEVGYPSHAGVQPRPLVPGEVLTLGQDQRWSLERLQLRADGGALEVRLNGVAREIEASSGGLKRDLRLTAFDALWHNGRAAVLFSIAVWAISVSAGAYRVYRGLATA